jgi:predicted Zn-dependent peptidase
VAESALVVKSSTLSALTAAAVAIAVGPAFADAPAPPAQPASAAVQALEKLALSIQRRTLANGLRVVMNPDPNAPTVAVSVTYDTGSRHEAPGRSGFAHLFEHMMFQGSRHVKKGQHFGLIAERGGNLNGTTSSDRTNYFEVLPSSELELALWLEADRMHALDVSAENFENQRAVVKEEYRMRYQNAPYALAGLRLLELVYVAYPPYANPTIGKIADLDGAELAWVQQFYQAHYAPNNAVLTISGGFEPDRALSLVERFFGPIPARKIAPFPAPPAALETRAVRESMEDANAKTPCVYYGWLIPPSHTPDHYALELATMLLGDGESARLYQKLVRTRALALDADAWTRDFRGPDQFVVQVVLAERATLKAVEKELDLELERLRKTPPSAEELKRVKQRLESSFVFGLEATMNRAVKLGEYELFWGDARGLTRELAQYQSVTAEQIRAAAERYLGPEHRVVLEVLPQNPSPRTPPSPATSPPAPTTSPPPAPAPATSPAPAPPASAAPASPPPKPPVKP